MYHESAETISEKRLWTHFATKMFLHMSAVSSVRESMCARACFHSQHCE